MFCVVKKHYKISEKFLMMCIKSRKISNHTFLKELEIYNTNPGLFDGKWGGSGDVIESISPASGCVIAHVQQPTLNEAYSAITKAYDAWPTWAALTPPERGEIVRQIGVELRKNKINLGKLISLEMGKIFSEGIGEVQEYIDICDYAVGLSRMIPGKLLPSERRDHTLLEKWNPLGAIGVITAFNFPVAVFGWNSAIAMICGNTSIWKCSPTTPLTAIAVTKIVSKVLQRNGIPASIATLLTGDADIGDILVTDKRIPLISFTGSTSSGKKVALKVQERFGRSLLELGGNNAIVVSDDADIDLAVKAAVFSCIGTAGQRCTTTRRLILHTKIKEDFVGKLKKAYSVILERIGNPLDEATLYSPLHSQKSVESYENTIMEAKRKGGIIEFGGNRINRQGFYVEPTIISNLNPEDSVVQNETFAPIVYLFEYDTLEQAIDLNNSVDQGLSSALFTENIGQLFKAAKRQLYIEKQNKFSQYYITVQEMEIEVRLHLGLQLHAVTGLRLSSRYRILF
ncbi:aldehyde dehydrogenase family 7-like isoform X1 [Nasonia vitripennis]|uniref:aldehyde dehydrogenase (NAD(+)) n=1 Tax=Nasonia vitripennis TaxID=7425 RepID=A0A7M7QQ42_NASVI|nr:aldehyde dehydrogenase family 7-like isoform X1 [Nasonia vitripennis]